MKLLFENWRKWQRRHADTGKLKLDSEGMPTLDIEGEGKIDWEQLEI
tara:strand:- start:48 stop:188 length:141 start_codon:yes stop_codon:yes gene_type:complete